MCSKRQLPYSALRYASIKLTRNVFLLCRLKTNFSTHSEMSEVLSEISEAPFEMSEVLSEMSKVLSEMSDIRQCKRNALRNAMGIAEVCI